MTLKISLQNSSQIGFIRQNWNLQVKKEYVYNFIIKILNFKISVCVHESHPVMSNSVTPETVACQSPLSMDFSRQEYWSGLPFLSPGDLPNPGIEPGSPALQADSLTSKQLLKNYC